MSIKQVMVFVDQGEQERRRQVEDIVARVSVTYPGSMLVEVDEEQAILLEREGFHLESLPDNTKIKLRSIEIEPAIEVPAVPTTMSIREEEADASEENFWIVQFIGPVKPEWIEAVQQLGGRPGEYIPENTFLFQMTSAVKEQVAELDFVRWVGSYQPAYKISPVLMGIRGKFTGASLGEAAIAEEKFKATPLGNLNVLLHNEGDRAVVVREIENLGGIVISSDRVSLRLSLEASQIVKLAALPGVQWIEPYVVPKLVNNVAAGIIGVGPVWNNHGLDGEGQIIAVADSGLDTGVNDATMHDDFEGRITAIHSWAIPAGLHGYMDNTTWDDGAADLNSGHGTHVAGSVLGNGSRSSGGIRGMAFRARLVFQAVEQYCDFKTSYQAQYPDGYYLMGIPDDLTTLFQQSYNDGARIFSNSWGGSTDAWGNHIYGQYTASSQDIDEFTWDHKDAVILFAAGNEGRDGNSDGVIDTDSLLVQATAKNCITVGASENNRPAGSIPAPGYDIVYGTGSWLTDFPVPPISTDHVSDDPEGMAAFSSRGPTDDGRIKPDIVAPGTNILSVRSSVAAETGWGLLPAGDARRDFYMYMGGTSMATPIAAGTAALVRQYMQSARLHDPSAALVKAMLIHGALPMDGQYTPPEVGAVPNNDEGWGRTNLEQALFPAYPAKLEFRDSATLTLGAGDSADHTFAVVNTSIPFRATLVWTDYPCTPAAAGLTNQLRLSVTAPDGTVTQSDQPNNNVQQVVVATPQVGNYTVRVSGVNVPTATMPGVNQKQDFALVVTAGLEFVDVYIRDNTADDGIPPSTGCLYLSPDIWVSLTDDPLAAPADNPEYGQTNYVFVRVHNRGSKAADNATVTLYWANPGTNLSKPHWKTSGIKVDGVVGNTRTVNVPAHNGSGAGEAVTAAFQWLPPDPAVNTVDPGHFCLFATISHPDDPVLQEDVDKVRWEDNLAWRNEIVQNVLADSTTSAEFYVAGIPGASIGALFIDCTGAPAGGEVILKVPTRYLEGTVSGLTKIWESEGGLRSRVTMPTGSSASLTGIKLRSRENTLIRIEVKLPPGVRAGEVYPVMVEQQVNGRTTGRVSLVARTVGTPAYIANRNPDSLELHLPNCSWAKRISGRHKVPYDDLELALRRGYNGCRFCLPDYNTG